MQLSTDLAALLAPALLDHERAAKYSHGAGEYTLRIMTTLRRWPGRNATIQAVVVRGVRARRRSHERDHISNVLVVWDEARQACR